MRWTPLALAASLLTLGIAPAAARFGFPDPATERAAIIEDVYVKIIVAGIIVFVFVFALMAYILIRYREHGGKGQPTFEKERDNLKAEMLWTLLPLAITLWVGVISYQALTDLDALDEEIDPYMTMDITAFQWAWQATYNLDGGESFDVLAAASADTDFYQGKEFVIPANRSILFNVGAGDVIHAWNIIQLQSVIDAVPGQINSLYVRDGLPAGEYMTQCRENCQNPGHGYMRAIVKAVEMDEYQEWVEQKLAGAAGLTQLATFQTTDGQTTQMKGRELAKGATVIFQFANDDDVTHTYTVGDETVEVAAGSLGTIEWVAEAEGDVTITDDLGNTFTATVGTPEEILVELADFTINGGDSLQLEGGKLYAIRATNTGNAPHNLYIGADGEDGKTDAIWSTGDILPNGEDTILVEASESGELDMWCAIGGHYTLGMFGTVTVV